MVITKWFCPKGSDASDICKMWSIPKGRHEKAVARHICYPMTPSVYIARTQAWRPLDIHPDWRTWDGATTKGNK